MPIHDLICRACETILRDQTVRGTEYGLCQCGAPFDWLPSKVTADAWGRPHYIASLDRTFDTKSDLRKELRRCGFEPAGDRVHGARNEDGYTGRSFSFTKQERRASPPARVEPGE